MKTVTENRKAKATAPSDFQFTGIVAINKRRLRIINALRGELNTGDQMNLNNPPVIIGIDPDSGKHGVAIYVGKKLYALHNWQALDLFFYLLENLDGDHHFEVHIENVCAINATFSKAFVKNARSQTTVSRSIGMCQQAQVEIERIAEHFKVKIVKHPINESWKDSKIGKKILKQLGWKGLSNENTRSAAYFGYVGVKQWHSINRK